MKEETEMSVSISIITVAFNSSKTISKAIESVLNQTYSPKEYIIIDGKSSDNTIAVAQSYTEQFIAKGIQYKIVSEKDNGIYDAMNKGIAMATGKIVGMINSDDWYENIALQTVAETYEKEKFDMMYADVNLVREGKEPIRKRSRLRKFITSRDWNHPTTFVKRTIYDKMQYRNDNLYADFDMLLKIRKQGYKVVVVNEVLANFGVGGVSNEKKLRSMVKRIKYRYDAYRENDCSRFYILECIFIEVAKFIMA